MGYYFFDTNIIENDKNDITEEIDFALVTAYIDIYNQLGRHGCLQQDERR